jgi:hypothetical protein
MELKVVHYVSDEDQKIVASRYFFDNKEISSEDFTELLVGCVESDEDCGFEDFDKCESYEIYDDEFEDICDDSANAELDMICDCASTINAGLCEAHVYHAIQDLFYTAKKLGYRDAKLEMIENLSEDIEILDE